MSCVWLTRRPRSEDWVALTEMLLGKVPNGFVFEPKHSSNSYERSVTSDKYVQPKKGDEDEW